jgi:glutaredoxin-like protein NrdH
MSYDSFVVKVPGENRGDIFVFALSTCVWCQKTKELLRKLGVQYRYIDVDLVEGEIRNEVAADLAAKNPDTSFPTIVLDDGSRVIIGFQEAEIRDFAKRK